MKVGDNVEQYYFKGLGNVYKNGDLFFCVSFECLYMHRNKSKGVEQNNCSNTFWMADDFDFFSFSLSVLHNSKTMSTSCFHNRITLFLKMED